MALFLKYMLSTWSCSSILQRHVRIVSEIYIVLVESTQLALIRLERDWTLSGILSELEDVRLGLKRGRGFG